MFTVESRKLGIWIKWGWTEPTSRAHVVTNRIMQSRRLIEKDCLYIQSRPRISPQRSEEKPTIALDVKIGLLVVWAVRYTRNKRLGERRGNTRASDFVARLKAT